MKEEFKEELIKFVMKQADKQYSDDFPILLIPEWINQFFDQYQPERSKREDLNYEKVNVKMDCDTSYPHDEKIIFKIRCSEHGGNTVSWVQ